jgi:hypothetical protein
VGEWVSEWVSECKRERQKFQSSLHGCE